MNDARFPISPPPKPTLKLKMGQERRAAGPEPASSTNERRQLRANDPMSVMQAEMDALAADRTKTEKTK